MEVFWKRLKANVKKFVAECETCERVKYEVASPMGLLQSFLIPSRVWEEISLDFIVGLPKVVMGAC